MTVVGLKLTPMSSEEQAARRIVRQYAYHTPQCGCDHETVDRDCNKPLIDAIARELESLRAVWAEFKKGVEP